MPYVTLVLADGKALGPLMMEDQDLLHLRNQAIDGCAFLEVKGKADEDTTVHTLFHRDLIQMIDIAQESPGDPERKTRIARP